MPVRIGPAVSRQPTISELRKRLDIKGSTGEFPLLESVQPVAEVGGKGVVETRGDNFSVNTDISTDTVPAGQEWRIVQVGVLADLNGLDPVRVRIHLVAKRRPSEGAAPREVVHFENFATGVGSHDVWTFWKPSQEVILRQGEGFLIDDQGGGDRIKAWNIVYERIDV